MEVRQTGIDSRQAMSVINEQSRKLMVTCVLYLSCRSRLRKDATGRIQGEPKIAKIAKRPGRPRRQNNDQKWVALWNRECSQVIWREK